MEQDDNKKKHLLPFILTIAIIVVDQTAKLLVVINIPLHSSIRIMEDFIRLTHVRNTAIAFGIGKDLPPGLKNILFLALPVIFLIALGAAYFKYKQIKESQRWIIASILGGGIGNMIDRFLRPHGVVDFVDIKCFGFFGFQRWPTFNAADFAIVTAGIFLIVSMINQEIGNLKKRDPFTKQIKNNNKGDHLE